MFGGLPVDPTGGFEAVDTGHPHVHQEHIRVLHLGGLDRGLAVGDDLDHLEIVLVVQRDLQGFTEGAVVVGDDDADVPLGRPRCLAVLRPSSGSHTRGIVGMLVYGITYPHRRIFPSPPSEGRRTPSDRRWISIPR